MTHVCPGHHYKTRQRERRKSTSSLGTPDTDVYAPSGTPEQGTSKYGTSLFMYSATAPTLLMSFHELKFLEAEALCRLGRVQKAP